MTTEATPLQRVASSLVTFALILPFMVGRKLATFAATIHDYQREWLEVLEPIGQALMRGDAPQISRAVFIASKGAGKDLTIAIFILWLVAFSPRALVIQVAAADEDQAGEVLKWIKMLLSWAPKWLKSKVQLQSWRLINRKTGSDAEVIACDVAGGAHGSRPDLLLVNEFTHITRWEFVETLIDNASKVANGAALFFGNAGFKESPQYRLYEYAKTAEHWTVHEYNQPAPHRDAKHLNDASVINSPSRNSRLNFGVWSSGTGDFISDIDIEAAIDRHLVRQESTPRGAIAVGGIDAGYSHDHFAITILAKFQQSGRAAHHQLLACDWLDPRDFPDNRIDPANVKAMIIGAHRRYRLKAFYYDPAEMRFMAHELRQQGIPMVEYSFAGQRLELLAQTIVQLFKERAIQLYPCDALIADVRKLAIVEQLNGKGLKLQAKRDKSGHADRGYALALAAVAAQSAHGSGVATWGGLVHPAGSQPSEYQLNAPGASHLFHRS